MLALSQAVGADFPTDVAIRIRCGNCWFETVDTDAGTFSRAIRRGTVRRARLGLRAVQKRQLFELIGSVDLFEYPQHFEPPGPALAEPATDYSIEIRSAGRRHKVQWVDYGSTDASATRLRVMLLAVRQWLVSLPAVQRLPPSQIVCL